MRQKKLFLISTFLVALLASSLTSQAWSAARTSTFFVSQTPSATEATVTFHGVIKPAIKNAVVRIYVKLDGEWIDTRLQSKSTSSGAWKIQSIATALSAKVEYRGKIVVGSKSIITSSKSITIKQVLEISNSDPGALITLMGPGGRIHGADISRWQHPNDKPIDFAKMYSAGIRFIMIKASDTRDDADRLALKYLLMDRNAAQAAGIYTGFYHFTILPDTTDPEAIIRDAKAQAQKALWRLASVGGYSQKDLPYALDFEYNCVQVSGGVCKKYSTRASATLWAETWLGTMAEKTGRKPFLYSYPTFLEGAVNRSDVLRQYPLWLAQYGINPADPVAEPGRKISGCYVHSWSTTSCTSLWQIWQYTSCGIASKYGVPGVRLDLNVFRGDPFTFLQLVKGEWIPQVGDLLPINEPTTLKITSSSAKTTDKVVKVIVEVMRSGGATPVVTGTVIFAASDTTLVFKQSATRAASGLWSLTIQGLPAGMTSGLIKYLDQSKTHAESSQLIEFQLEQGPTPTPSPSPSKKPTPARGDGCAKQIKN